MGWFVDRKEFKKLQEDVARNNTLIDALNFDITEAAFGSARIIIEAFPDLCDRGLFDKVKWLLAENKRLTEENTKLTKWRSNSEGFLREMAQLLFPDSTHEDNVILLGGIKAIAETLKDYEHAYMACDSIEGLEDLRVGKKVERLVAIIEEQSKPSIGALDRIEALLTHKLTAAEESRQELYLAHCELISFMADKRAHITDSFPMLEPYPLGNQIDQLIVALESLSNVTIRKGA